MEILVFPVGSRWFKPQPRCVQLQSLYRFTRSSSSIRRRMATNTATMGHLPSGSGICTTLPDILYLPELIFGGLVWILVASTYVLPHNPQGWVMAVSIFCFIMTFVWLVVFACGVHQNKASWAAADFIYHFLATTFYLSASTSLAFVTLVYEAASSTLFKSYQLNIAAVVFSFVATLLYFIHTILSAMRWRSF